MGDQIPDAVKEERNRILLEVLQRNSLRRTAKLIGTTEEVLVEGRDKSGQRFTGRTPGNRVCVFDAHPRLIGQLVPLRIERATVSTLYGDLVAAGIPAEDARFVFPNATRTNLIMTVNLRALIHMSGLRLCTMAQWEIRRLFQLIRHEVFAVSPFLGSFLAPKCVPLGYCDEAGNRDGHCPIRPHKDDVLGAWAEKAAAAKANGRALPIAE
mgnify:CR=1 FL=1